MNCGKLTGIFGTNSSGKTSLIQFLLLLKQTKEATDRKIALDLNGDIVQLGSIKDAIFQHDETNKIEIGLTFDLQEKVSLNDPSKQKSMSFTQGDELATFSIIEVTHGQPSVVDLKYTLGAYNFQLSQKVNRPSQFELKSESNDKKPNDFTFIRSPGRAWPLPGPIKTHAFPDQARTYFQNAGFLADLELEYEKQLDKFFYLGPLREFPKRDYLWARSRPTDVGQRGEKTIDVILAATEAGEKRNLRPRAPSKSFQGMIAYWLKEMGLVESFDLVEIAPDSNRWQARLQTRPGASQVLLTDVGFGVSQVLPVITLLEYVPEGSTVILEQPEIHLHPLAQANLADFLIYVAMRRNVRVIVESHSEHLLLRLQRRIAENEKISANDVCLYFCDSPTGTSVLTPLNVDMYGRILNWPRNFMGNAFTETANAEQARLRRALKP